MNRVRVFALLAGVAVSVVAFAQARPDYSGEWVLNLQRSKLDQRLWDGLERGTLRTVHKEPRMEFRFAFVQKGRPDETAWTMTSDGQEQVRKLANQTRYSRLSWTDGILVLSERAVAPQGEAANTVEYRLLENGRVFQAHERFKGPRFQYENVYVFEKR